MDSKLELVEIKEEPLDVKPSVTNTIDNIKTENENETENITNEVCKKAIPAELEDNMEIAESNEVAVKQESEKISDNTTVNENDEENDEDAIMCKVCTQKFVDEFDLELHYKSRRLAERTYRCCSCFKTFRDNSQLNVHARKHTGEQPYACKECGKRFSVNGNLNKHMRIHTGERRFECDTCDRKFTQFAHLEDHLKIHSGEKPYLCDYCNCRFKTKARLKKHKKSHDKDNEEKNKRSMVCPLCPKVLRNSKQLASHLETHNAEDTDPYSCGTCGATYTSFSLLEEHKRNHIGHRAFRCTLCIKTFSSISKLRRHINSHTGVKPYACEICLKGFPTPKNLKRHRLTHSDIKPFVCNECNRGFLTLENLNRHKRIHTGEKPFQCDLCGKYFAHITTVKDHRRLHTGERPFVCTFCDKAFAVNKLLYRHVREKHPERYEAFKAIQEITPNLKSQLAFDIVHEEYQQPDYVESSEVMLEYNKQTSESKDLKTNIKQEVDNSNLEPTDQIPIKEEYDNS